MKQQQSYQKLNLEFGANITKHKTQPKVMVIVKIVLDVRPDNIGGRCHPEREKLGPCLFICHSIAINKAVT